MRRIATLFAGLALAGCASAGTNFDPAAVANLHPGMSESDVTVVLGRPNGESTLADGSKVDVWLFSHANALTGASSARSVSLLFDARGRFVRQTGSTGVQGRY